LGARNSEKRICEKYVERKLRKNLSKKYQIIPEINVAI